MKKQFTQNEIPEIAKEILSLLPKNQRATVVALSGDLGAGKTTLTQSIAREFGIAGNIVSPTFVIMKKYAISKRQFATLVHIDAYRLDSPEDLRKLGWMELLADPSNLIVIEWPEKAGEAIPKDAFRISLSHKDDETREILY